MSDTAPVSIARDLGPATERQVAGDLARRGLLLLPVGVAVAGLLGGFSAAASVGFAAAVVLVNLWISAALLGWAARISYGLVMAVALFGFLARMGLVAGVVLLVQDQSWVRPLVLGLTLVVTHLGLLAWETRYVSATLAFPGLEPTPHGVAR
jgi:hypothetical protein